MLTAPTYTSLTSLPLSALQCYIKSFPFNASNLPTKWHLQPFCNSFTSKFQDVNDHAPVFTQSTYEVRLYENITVGSEVALVRATDRDSGENKVIEYSFADGAGLENFYIDISSGRITVKNNIDRDPPLNQTMFNITVSLFSEKFSSSKDHSIGKNDENFFFPRIFLS